MEHLPPEILLYIFKYISPHGLCSLSKVNKRFNRVSICDYLWKRLLYLVCHYIPECGNYKNTFKHEYLSKCKYFRDQMKFQLTTKLYSSFFIITSLILCVSMLHVLLYINVDTNLLDNVNYAVFKHARSLLDTHKSPMRHLDDQQRHALFQRLSIGDSARDKYIYEEIYGTNMGIIILHTLYIIFIELINIVCMLILGAYYIITNLYVRYYYLSNVCVCSIIVICLLFCVYSIFRTIYTCKHNKNAKFTILYHQP